jgi:hypothetical protein
LQKAIAPGKMNKEFFYNLVRPEAAPCATAAFVSYCAAEFASAPTRRATTLPI